MAREYQPDFETGCRYKFGHRTKGDAINQSIKRNGNGGSHKRLGVYHCTFCNLWHVGKQSGVKSRKLKPYSKKDRHQKGYN